VLNERYNRNEDKQRKKAVSEKGTERISAAHQAEPVTDPRPAAMERLVHELISDRLLTLSRYITLDSSTRTILIDQTS